MKFILPLSFLSIFFSYEKTEGSDKHDTGGGKVFTTHVLSEKAANYNSPQPLPYNKLTFEETYHGYNIDDTNHQFEVVIDLLSGMTHSIIDSSVDPKGHKEYSLDVNFGYKQFLFIDNCKKIGNPKLNGLARISGEKITIDYALISPLDSTPIDKKFIGLRVE